MLINFISITLFISIILIIVLLIFKSKIYKTGAVYETMLLIFGCITFLCIMFSFTIPFKCEKLKIDPSITNTPTAIFVTGPGYEFILREIKHQNISSAKNIYIQKYINTWGIDYTSKQTLIWENY